MFTIGLPAKSFLSGLVFFSMLAAPGWAGDRWVVDEIALQNSLGVWEVIAHPDHPMDVASQEFGVSFFNQGRVPSGEYRNARLVASPLGDHTNPIRRLRMALKQDLAKPFTVRKNSFISVWFHLNPVDIDRALSIRDASITVDDFTQRFASEEIEMAYDQT